MTENEALDAEVVDQERGATLQTMADHVIVNLDVERELEAELAEADVERQLARLERETACRDDDYD